MIHGEVHFLVKREKCFRFICFCSKTVKSHLHGFHQMLGKVLLLPSGWFFLEKKVLCMQPDLGDMKKKKSVTMISSSLLGQHQLPIYCLLLLV